MSSDKYVGDDIGVNVDDSPIKDEAGMVLEAQSALDEDQLQRVEALRVARDVLSSTNLFGKGSIDNVDGVIRVARYITTGRDLSFSDDAFAAHDRDWKSPATEGRQMPQSEKSDA